MPPRLLYCDKSGLLVSTGGPRLLDNCTKVSGIAGMVLHLIDIVLRSIQVWWRCRGQVAGARGHEYDASSVYTYR